MQFREMRRKNQEIPESECREILQSEKRGIFAVHGDFGYPYAVPVNFYYDPAEHAIYLHSAKAGHKLDAVRENPKVCFTVLEQGVKMPGDWAYYVRSVIIFGKIEMLSDPELIREKVKLLGLKYYPTEQDVDRTMQKHLPNLELLAIRIESMTGKLVHEK
ncbi:MAG: pyridoxamine 5'-phosphate oxidase family protein [Oscillospiraceae bacterium]|nr:pyridoxamine 5'-phosphate oxidase family protein [Oscillospiraceae bacterium]